MKQEDGRKHRKALIMHSYDKQSAKKEKYTKLQVEFLSRTAVKLYLPGSQKIN
jgi:hypothetical protein